MPRNIYDAIQEVIGPETIDKFLAKSGDYGDSWRLLGAKGQFSDINRKFWKLYNSIWLGHDLTGEQPDECVEDIIGHCFILLYILRYDPEPERALFSSHERDVPPTLPSSGPGKLPEGRGGAPK